MAYLLDTNAVIALLKNHAAVLAHVRRVGLSPLWICAPVEAELWFGVWKSAKPQENRRWLLTLLSWLPSLPFDSEAAAHCGEIRATLARQGTPIGPYDVQIAAIAQARDFVLVTHNTHLSVWRVCGSKIGPFPRQNKASRLSSARRAG